MQKINLYVISHDFEPKAECSTFGLTDLYFPTEIPFSKMIKHVQISNADISEDLIRRFGA
jgi:hypothetical protein